MVYSEVWFMGRKLIVAADQQGITWVGSPLEGLDTLQSYYKTVSLVRNDEFFDDLRVQLKEYESKERQSFDIPLHLIGTEFRIKVWNALLQVPFGKIVSYTEIANRIGQPQSVRAVASAIGKNPIMLLVPCHRVNGKDGKLRGFRGGIDLKIALQAIES